MFDFQVSTHSHFDEACREFAAKHNIIQLAKKAGLNPQTIRNKLNPEQVHQLTVREMLILTDLTEDATLVDGMLAQLQCLPCVPVNEVAQEKLSSYVLKATAEVMAQGGRRWHPSNNQAELLAGLTGNGSNKKWQLKVKTLLRS